MSFKFTDGSSPALRNNHKSKAIPAALIKTLEESGWKLDVRNQDYFMSKYARFSSTQPGYSGGRYTIYIRVLLKKCMGCKYQLVVDFTPYNGEITLDCKYKTTEELVNALKEHCKGCYITVNRMMSVDYSLK